MWLPEDTEAELEWIVYEASLCPGCGKPKDECMDDANALAYEAIDAPCYACRAKDAAMRQAREAIRSGGYGDGALDGLYFGVTERR